MNIVISVVDLEEQVVKVLNWKAPDQMGIMTPA